MFLTIYNSQPLVRCRYCLEQIKDTSAGCQTCQGQGKYKSAETPSLIRRLINSTQTPSLFRRLVNSFRKELSTELVVLTLENSDQLFSDKEIEMLLDLEEIVPLELEDVPNWHLMFLDSKRISKPNRRLVSMQNSKRIGRPEGRLISMPKPKLRLTN